MALLAASAGAERRAFGSLALEACGADGGYCGTVERPLDPLGTVPGTIPVYFEFYPHRDPGNAAGTLIATEGGPGYPATLSRAAYLALFAPLRADHDVLIMDNRGTGRSGAVDCEPLQRAPSLAVADIGRCGVELGARAPLYSTAYAADDLDAIADALGVGSRALYGDSYGTFFAQVYALRHPGRLTALVLDGAYPLHEAEPGWWPHYAPAVVNRFARACERDAGCAADGAGSLAHLAGALAELRRRPFAAHAPDYDGVTRRFTASAGAFATLLFGAAPALAQLRETDAAARAFVAGDRAPLLRLLAEAQAAVDSRDPSFDPRQFSAGLAAAVTCQDGAQVFDMRLPPAARRAERERVLAARRARVPDSYAPFTIDEYRQMPPDYAFIDECIDWPEPDARHPPGAATASDAAFPDVPVLVVSGELDAMTPLAEGEATARQFARATHLVVANGWHVNALAGGRSRCVPALVVAFLRRPGAGVGALESAAGCTAAAPPLRLAPPFVQSYRHAAPATALPGNRAAPAALLAAGALVATVGDLLPRLAANQSGRGLGLRGGRFTVAARAGDRLAAHLVALRWAADLAVSGTVRWDPAADAGEARLRFRARDGTSGRVALGWRGDGSAARLEGRAGGRALLAGTRAP
jgi:pimeloyl-ACP methyl ester carboxylesterase